MSHSTVVWERITELKRAGIDCVVATVVAVRGSVPGMSGNKGGGDGRWPGLPAIWAVVRVEARAIEEAQAMLLDEIGEPIVERDWNLQRDIGMTCGGEMRFSSNSFKPERNGISPSSEPDMSARRLCPFSRPLPAASTSSTSGTNG